MVSFGCGRPETGAWKSTHRCGTGYQNEKSNLMPLFIYEAKHKIGFIRAFHVGSFVFWKIV